MAHPQPGGTEKSSPRRRKRWLIASLTGILACSLLLFYFSASLAQATGKWLDIGRPLTKPVDLVYVLGGGAHLRPLVAAEIYKAGYAPKILIAAPDLLPDSLQNSQTEAELVSKLLKVEGVPESAMQQIPLPAISTRGEILALRDYLKDRPVQEIAIVTDHYHTRRVSLLTRQILTHEEASRIFFVSCPTDGYDKTNWWKYETGLRTYWLELVKLTVAKLNF